MIRSLCTLLLTSTVLVITLSACSKSTQEEPKPEVDTPLVVEPEVTTPKVATPADIDLSGRPPKMLSDFHFFQDLPAQIPNEGIFAYAVNTDHFADYASVQRFFWLPEGTTINYTAQDVFELPLGSIIIQTFSFPDATVQGGKRHVETRLLMNGGGMDGWEFMVYKWNAEMTDAKRAVAGGPVQVPDVHGNTPDKKRNYLIPNINECSRCHENNNGMSNPVGFTARNLSRQIEGKHQLSQWVTKGILNNAPEQADVFPLEVVWNDPTTGSVATRARAWLDVNCAHCHNPNGPGSVSGLDLSILQNNPMSIGMYKPPVAAGRGSEGFRFSIDPGSPETSFMVNRLHSTDPSVMMPPLGRMNSNKEAVALISEWIANIEFSEDAAQALITEQKQILKKRFEEAGGTSAGE